MRLPGAMAFLACVAGACAAAGAGERDVRAVFQITYNSAPDADRLDVTLDITGLDPTGTDVRLYFEEWGRWTELDSLYLRCVRSEPPARRDPSVGPALKIEVPAGWDGRIRAEYQIPLIEDGSTLHEREGLLPWRSRALGARPPYVVAFANNTLPRIVVGDAIVNVKPEVVLRAPAGMSVASGWGGVAAGEQRVKPGKNIDKTPILFGKPVGISTATEGGTTFEVVQFSGTRDVSPEVLGLVRALTPEYARSTGHPAKGVERVFIVGGGGGQQTDGGLFIGINAEREGTLDSPYLGQLVAHELFHEWLGGAAHGDGESDVWFKEGFTDYLSIRGCAGAGVVTWDWFASRLAELEQAARTGSAYGRVAFGARGTNWRDGDGPRESLAYKGGAVLALCMDVELISRGHAGLPAMIGDLIAQNGGEYSLTTIREWMGAHGLAEFYASYIEAPALPDVGAALVLAGFEVRERVPAKLTYFGISTDGGTGLGRVTEVDPAGPGAAAGVRVGDVINGMFPVRGEGDRPRVSSSVTTRHRFGLNMGRPDTEETVVCLERDGVQAKVRARVIDGGEFVRFAPTERVAKFFATGATK